MAGTPALRRLRQEDHKFKASLGYKGANLSQKTKHDTTNKKVTPS
jgi:hypothetical protein